MKHAGFVLAGGMSSRMGRDKALAAYRGAPLVAHIAGEVRDAAGSVVVIGGESRIAPLGLPAVGDLTPGCGPAGGILTALEITSAEWNLVVACDMPRITAGFLRELLASAEGSRAACLVPLPPSGRPQPLCAVYRRGCRAEIARALRRGERRLTEIVSAINPFFYNVLDEACFENLNTPRDWARHHVASREAGSAPRAAGSHA